MENILSIQQQKNRWQRAALMFGAAILAALAIWMISSQVAGGLAQQRQVRALATFEEETGIRILRVALTAGGGMVDLQYQVINPDKALIVHDDDNPPMLMEENDKLVLATPFHDHSFRELHTAVTYHELITNGGGLLDRGSKVTLKVGDSFLEHLIVQ